MANTISVIFLFLLLTTQNINAREFVTFPEAPNNVAYGAVTELPFRTPDYQFNYGSEPLQFALLWNRTRNIGDTPLIVMIHGGCWLNAFDVTHTKPMATALSQQGYNVLSVEYRRTGDEGGGWPGSYRDIIDAVRKLQQLEKYFVDTKEIILMGHSAGGHLALLAGAAWQQQSLFASELKAVVGLAAITDIETYAKGTNSCQKATPKFMGGAPAERKAAYQAANPRNHTMAANTVLLHGDQDAIVPVQHTTYLPVTNKVIPNAGHFDWIHPGSPAFYQLLNTLEMFWKSKES